MIARRARSMLEQSAALSTLVEMARVTGLNLDVRSAYCVSPCGHGCFGDASHGTEGTWSGKTNGACRRCMPKGRWFVSGPSCAALLSTLATSSPPRRHGKRTRWWKALCTGCPRHARRHRRAAVRQLCVQTGSLRRHGMRTVLPGAAAGGGPGGGGGGPLRREHRAGTTPTSPSRSWTLRPCTRRSSSPTTWFACMCWR